MLIKYFTELYFTGLGALNQFQRAKISTKCAAYFIHHTGWESYPHMLADITPTPTHKPSIGDVTKLLIEENGKLITI